MLTLSIITPTYNRAAVIGDNFAGVLSQSFTDLEHIIVDNLSSDDTAARVAAYTAQAPYPVIYLREPDHGMYDAINKGLKRAHGVWTHILNSDDRYAGASALSEVFALDLAGYDMIVNAVRLVNQDDPQRDHIWKPEFRTAQRHYFFPHPGIIERRAYYEDHGYYLDQYRIVSDAIYAAQHYEWMRYLLNADHVLTVMDEGGMSNLQTWANLREALINIFRYQKYPMTTKLRYAAYRIKSILLARIGRPEL
jgi:glycosyltransferase involved in cell wall biosynthesis